MDRRTLIVLAAGSLVVGCAVDPAARTLPVISFESGQPHDLDVATIEFVNAVGDQSIAPPGRDMRFAMEETPGSVARRWSRERLDASGSLGMARVILEESRFVAVPLDTKSGIEGFFTDEQSVRYEGSMALRIDVVDHPAGYGFAEARSTRSRTVPESLSLADREEVLHTMLADIIASLDARLETEMRRHLTRWLR